MAPAAPGRLVAVALKRPAREHERRGHVIPRRCCSNPASRAGWTALIVRLDDGDGERSREQRPRTMARTRADHPSRACAGRRYRMSPRSTALDAPRVERSPRTASFNSSYLESIAHDAVTGLPKVGERRLVEHCRRRNMQPVRDDQRSRHSASARYVPRGTRSRFSCASRDGNPGATATASVRPFNHTATAADHARDCVQGHTRRSAGPCAREPRARITSAAIRPP